MIERYTVDREGRLVSKRTGELVADDNRPIGSPQISRDYTPYQSQASGRMIEGRSQHREELKRTGCRVMEKGEWNPVYKNPEFARKRGLPLEGE